MTRSYFIISGPYRNAVIQDTIKCLAFVVASCWMNTWTSYYSLSIFPWKPLYEAKFVYHVSLSPPPLCPGMMIVTFSKQRPVRWRRNTTSIVYGWRLQALAYLLPRFSPPAHAMLHWPLWRLAIYSKFDFSIHFCTAVFSSIFGYLLLQHTIRFY